MSEDGTSSRRAAREAAFRASYASIVGHASEVDALGPETLGEQFDAESLAFVGSLYRGAVTDAESWMEMFKAHLAKGWQPERIALTDRILLCMACHELWTMTDVPPKVTLNEYVSLAKKYGSADSGKFVNGVLAKVLADSPKSDWTPPPKTPKPKRSPKKVAQGSPGPEKKGRWVVKADR